ncbi:hypothetical protein NP493_287g03011 [Ridgeia piscesae]|uniref:Major facilitator superfamily (MFS) profile domain-containing protein n=1 Tax=Ridgeia piscesae TaxID=27915 RepID=A0AAD9NWY8_RIDPI|nr:hypothetical protein NP493_287g03011 [Ridgeia piscesae]
MYNYINGSYSNNTITCPNGWYYDPKPIRSSVVTEWDLVCSKDMLPETSLTVFNVGVMLGAILFGFLSDKFGRKRCFVCALFLQSIVGSLTATAQNFYVFMILRFIVGALEQGVNITGYIMSIELFPPKQRTIFGVGHEFLWAIGGAMIPFFAYFLRDWRHLQLCVSLPGALGIFLWWLIPESTVWLLAQGRVAEAEDNLAAIARFNKATLPPNCLSDHEKKADVITAKTPVHTYTFIDLFRTPSLCKITLCICTLWALNTLVYYGLTYNTPNLDGDMYVNFFIGQMVEIPSVAATMYLIYRIGRRLPLCFFHVFCGLVCIACPFIPAQTASGFDLTWVAVTLAMLGKFSINASFTIIYIYGPEIYPTVLRNTGAGLASFSGRFGGIIYPYISYLKKVNLGTHGDKLPLIIFGSFSIIGGLLALPLPETRHNPLPESIDDVEHYAEFCKEARRQSAMSGGVAAAGSSENSTEMQPLRNGNAKEVIL